ncbi:DUF169 domain-containing protein [Oryzomonas sagensis]|uniref:DUF169 domain-containing protein n=1 Tax=Oryzomonas sagensis TaxID=2603857 RepID=A0ABQ6TS32_9BACT|nr:DUF169 domain-containing protein [Oryzomonas sagensis]KAB0671846.1 DUF169 domain-containing protein [Oryzomonas sagensis]
MESLIAKALHLETEPVAICYSDTKPEGAVQFAPGTVTSCVMFLFASALRGKTVVFDRESYGCFGGGVGIGLGNTYEQFPGGVPGFCRFLSNGNESDPVGNAIGEGMKTAGVPGQFVDQFLHGELYKKSPELADQFVADLPIMEIPARYVVMRPLSQIVPERDKPVSVSFLVNPDQLSALVILANYDRPGQENVAIPYAAACQVIGILSYKEAASERQRCMVGMTDISARKNLKGQGMADKLTFTAPFRRLCEMESQVPGSFFERTTWGSIVS